MYKYGIRWDDRVDELAVETWMYKNQNKAIKLNAEIKGKAFHLERVMRMRWPEPELIWHPWLYETIDIWCKNDFLTIWGAAATSKSNSIGAIVAAEYMMDPKNTSVFLASTDLEMLQIRIWEAIQRYVGYCIHYRKDPFKMLRRPPMVIRTTDEQNGEDQDYSSLKSAIRGVGVGTGDEQSKASKLIGGHLPYVILVLDEMQDTPPAAFAARHNLGKGCKQFKFCGIGNPRRWDDSLVRASMPINGKASITIDSKRWRNKFGETIRYDGLKSPAIVEKNGAEKYPFLIKQSEIDRDYPDEDEKQTPFFNQMVRGWPTDDGDNDSVLSASLVDRHGSKERPSFVGDHTVIAALDPAFTSGGDACLLTVGRIGTIESGLYAIVIDDQVKIHIKAGGSPVQYQIVENVSKYFTDKKIRFNFNNFGIDESGTQRLGDVFDKELGCHVHRCNSGGKPSNSNVSEYSNRKGVDEYDRRVTELYYSVRELVVSEQLFGLEDDALNDFYSRRVGTKTNKKSIETKREMKKRTNGRSPDNGDSLVVLVDLAIARHGLYAGCTLLERSDDDVYDDNSDKNVDMYADENKYVTNEFQMAGEEAYDSEDE